jgi:hypothetical protein
MVADAAARHRHPVGPPTARVNPVRVLQHDNATPVLALTFECAVDAGLFEPCESPASVQGLLPGEHTPRGSESAGNPDPTPATNPHVMCAPVTTISSGPALKS